MKQFINEAKRMQQLAGIINENEDSKKIYGIEKNNSPYEFGPYTYDEAKDIAEKYMIKDPNNLYQPRLYNDMLDELPAIERMGKPRIDKDGNLYNTDATSFSSGDLADY